MQITLKHEDVVKAVVSYVGSQGFDIESVDCEVEFLKARKTAEISAFVEMKRKESTSVGAGPLSFDNDAA